MAVVVDSGELPSAKGKSGYDLDLVLTRWASIADGQFETDCRSLLKMIDEVDELELWKIAKGGFYKTRDEFLQKVVLIDFDLTEKSLSEIVARLRKGEQFGLPPVGKPGTNQYTGAVRNTNAKTGTDDATYAIRRLKRDHPDLFERVKAGELSANAAAIEAGFRKKTFAVPDDLAAATKTLVRHFGIIDALALADAIEREATGRPVTAEFFVQGREKE